RLGEDALRAALHRAPVALRMHAVDVRSPGIRVDGIVPVAARVNADPDVEVRANALPHAGHQPDDVLAAALPVMFVGFNIQNDGLDARYRCRLHNQFDLPVDLDSAQHLPGVKLQPVVSQGVDPAPDVLRPADFHRLFAVVRALPFRTVARFHEDRIDNRGPCLDHPGQLVYRCLADRVALPVPQSNLVLIR